MSTRKKQHPLIHNSTDVHASWDPLEFHMVQKKKCTSPQGTPNPGNLKPVARLRNNTRAAGSPRPWCGYGHSTYGGSFRGDAASGTILTDSQANKLPWRWQFVESFGGDDDGEKSFALLLLITAQEGSLPTASHGQRNCIAPVRARGPRFESRHNRPGRVET